MMRSPRRGFPLAIAAEISVTFGHEQACNDIASAAIEPATSGWLLGNAFALPNLPPLRENTNRVPMGSFMLQVGTSTMQRCYDSRKTPGFRSSKKSGKHVIRIGENTAR